MTQFVSSDDQHASSGTSASQFDQLNHLALEANQLPAAVSSSQRSRFFDWLRNSPLSAQLSGAAERIEAFDERTWSVLCRMAPTNLPLEIPRQVAVQAGLGASAAPGEFHSIVYVEGLVWELNQLLVSQALSSRRNPTDAGENGSDGPFHVSPWHGGRCSPRPLLRSATTWWLLGRFWRQAYVSGSVTAEETPYVHDRLRRIPRQLNAVLRNLVRVPGGCFWSHWRPEHLSQRVDELNRNVAWLALPLDPSACKSRDGELVSWIDDVSGEKLTVRQLVEMQTGDSPGVTAGSSGATYRMA